MESSKLVSTCLNLLSNVLSNVNFQNFIHTYNNLINRLEIRFRAKKYLTNHMSIITRPAQSWTHSSGSSPVL